jgi:hypothetical protein
VIRLAASEDPTLDDIAQVAGNEASPSSHGTCCETSSYWKALPETSGLADSTLWFSSESFSAGLRLLHPYAKILGHKEAAKTLQTILDEEAASDKKLTVASRGSRFEKLVNQQKVMNFLPAQSLKTSADGPARCL